jgi:hypothetical protein
MKIKLSHIRYIAPILIIAIFFLPSITYAADRPWWDVLNLTGTINDTLLNSLNGILGFFKTALSTILGSAIIPLLNNVMSFQNFFTDGVNAGWTATRDFANLFFALILLFIAIATVLNTGGLDNYTAKRMLPNFIFAALFINFSKAIVGFLIDISQIIMISLYNSFGPTLTDSIASASKIAEAGSESKIDPAIISLLTIILLVILIFVLLWTAVILIVRIVTLWFVIMLSPLAFVSGLIPPLSSISRSWQNMLQQALITGPTLMFLLYLAVTVMNASIGGNTSGGGNLIENGNLLNYALVIGLLIIANIEAQKAGQSAPPMLKNAVGVAGTVATFGLGAYVGAGGVGTGKMFGKGGELVQGGIKNTDKLVGGATNIAGGIGGVTGIKALQNANQKFESAKKDLKDRQARGVGAFKAIQGFSAEGKKQQLEDFEKEKAIRLFNTGQLEEKGNERYQKMAATLQGAAATDVKDEFNVEKLGKDMEKALEDGDKFTAMALSTRISELKGWSQIFAPGSKFAKYAEENELESAQLDGFITDNFETKDSSGNAIGNKTTNSFRSRQANILNDKGVGNFASGLAERKVKDPDLSPASKAAKAGLIGAGAMLAKNNSIFNTRTKNPDKTLAFKNNKAQYDFNLNTFAPVIANETSLPTLEKPESWNQYGPVKKSIIEGIQEYLAADNTARSQDKFSNIYGKISDDKLRSALKGLGSSASSRVTDNNT